MAMTWNELRWSRHRGAYAWALILFAIVALMLIAYARHAGYNGPAFPNRSDTQSDRAGRAANNTGLGDVGDTGLKR